LVFPSFRKLTSVSRRISRFDGNEAMDEVMGTVNVFCRFGNSENGMPDSHLFRLVNGRYRWIHTLSVNLTGKPIVVEPQGFGE
jgi:hypothetical protein